MDLCLKHAELELLRGAGEAGGRGRSEANVPSFRSLRGPPEDGAARLWRLMLATVKGVQVGALPLLPLGVDSVGAKLVRGGFPRDRVLRVVVPARIPIVE